MKVYIKKQAFIDMVIAAIEVYKKECLGILLGKRTKNKYVIEDAISYQTAKRKFGGVLPRKKKEKMLRHILKIFKAYKQIGDFHSHAQYGEIRGTVHISKEDEKDIIGTNLVSIIIGINESERKVKWYQGWYDITGSIDKYHICITAYYYDKKEKKCKRANIFCPYALKFGGAV